VPGGSESLLEMVGLEVMAEIRLKDKQTRTQSTSQKYASEQIERTKHKEIIDDRVRPGAQLTISTSATFRWNLGCYNGCYAVVFCRRLGIHKSCRRATI